MLMFKSAVYSVISPEGCAAILWQSQSKVKEAAEALKLTADDLLKLGVIDDVIPEPLEGAHRDWETTFENFRTYLKNHLKELKQTSLNDLLKLRYQKLRNIGIFLSNQNSAE
jgi:acetyl-CoA carboxylase carboxyl transferase subunit alpha